MCLYLNSRLCKGPRTWGTIPRWVNSRACQNSDTSSGQQTQFTDISVCKQDVSVFCTHSVNALAVFVELFATTIVSVLVDRSMHGNPPPSLESATNRLPIATESPYGKEASLRPISEMTIPFKTAPLFTMETWRILCLVNSEINRRSLPNPQIAKGSRTGVFSGRVDSLLQSSVLSRSRVSSTRSGELP